MLDSKQTNKFLNSNWTLGRLQIQNLLKKVEYMEIVNNIIEHIVFPACDRLEFHITFTLNPLFFIIKEVNFNFIKLNY